MGFIHRILRNPHLREILLFVFVGGVSTVFNYFVFWICLEFLSIFYLFSSWAGYIAGVFLGYTLNARYTFRAGPKLRLGQGAAYLSVYLTSLALSTLFLYTLVDLIGMSPKIANILAIMQTTLTNYLGCKFIVFRTIRTDRA